MTTTPRFFRALCLGALALVLASCASSCPNDGRELSVSLHGLLKGTTIGNGAPTLRSDHGIDRVAEQSRIGDPGLKYTSSEVMCLLWDQLEFEKRALPGPLLSDKGFEIRSGDAVVLHYSAPSRSVEDALLYKSMLDDFLSIYNQTFALQSVPEKEGQDMIKSTQRATRGSN